MWKDGLLIKLHDAVVKGGMFYWIKDFLNNRSIQVKIMGDLAALNILLYDCQVERIHVPWSLDGFKTHTERTHRKRGL